MRHPTILAALVFMTSAPAAAIPSVRQADLARHKDIADAMNAAVAEFLKPGQRRPDRDKGGIDIVKLIEAAPGGANENYLVEAGKDGEAVITILGAKDYESKLPSSWKPKLHAGSSKSPAATDDLTIAGLDGPYFVVGWESRRPVGDAYCGTGSLGGHLYESSAVKAKSEIPASYLPVLFHSAATRFERTVICWRYDRDGDGFRTSYFLEDGRTLPILDEMSGKTSIVRARPIEELLAKQAK